MLVQLKAYSVLFYSITNLAYVLYVQFQYEQAIDMRHYHVVIWHRHFFSILILVDFGFLAFSKCEKKIDWKKVTFFFILDLSQTCQ